jgi:hypothetical protein
VTVDNKARTVTVVGPIDLNGKEDRAYFWVRVTQAGGAEAVGVSDLDKDELTDRLNEAKAHLTKKVAAVAGADGRSSGPSTAQVDDLWGVTATWGAELEFEDKAPSFDLKKSVRVEAWASVEASRPKLTFEVHWVEASHAITAPASGSRSSRARAGSAARG